MAVRRPELVLAAAVALCLPMVPGILNGGIGAMTALVRFLIALLACWVAGALLSKVLTRYNEESRRAEIVRTIEAAQRSAAESAADADAARRRDQAGPVGGPASG